MDGFLLEIITPEKQFFKGEAEQIICETESGKLGILKGHQTMVSALEIGEIQIKVNGEWKSAFISEGFMEVRRDEGVIFSQCCQWPDEIDGAVLMDITMPVIDGLEATKRIRALDRLHLAENIKEHRHNEISLARAMARLKVKNKL